MRLAAFLATVAVLLSPYPAGAHDLVATHVHGGIKVVSTTGIVNDVVTNIGGDRVSVKFLMGPGVDPHLYKATAGDIKTLAGADVIFYHGLHLEGKISDVLESMDKRRIKTVAVSRDIPESMLIPVGKKGVFDPHVWFDPHLWIFAVRAVSQTLSEMDPANAGFYSENTRNYIAKLLELDRYAEKMVSAVPENKKFIVTSHDAFGYFARAYGFKVTALQGVSTVSEASISDVHHTVKTIIDKGLPAIFTESSISPRYINTVKEAVEFSGMSVKIGGKLYSDALGSPESRQGSFYGMFKHNVDTICFSLSGGASRELAVAPGKEFPEAKQYR